MTATPEDQRMVRAAAVALLLIVALAVGACGDEPQRVTAADLEGKAFVSTSTTGTPLDGDLRLTLEFEQGMLSASIGCNQINGAFSVKRSVLKQSQGVRTQMYCGVGPEEDWVAAFLERGARVTKLEHTLTLAAGDAKIVLQRTRRSGPPPVVGTQWTLREFHASSGVPPEVPVRNAPTLKLTADGKAEIFTGCNRGAGRAEFADGFVTFGAIATTKMACAPPVDELEREYLKLLSGKTAAGFSGTGDLTLAKDGDALVFAATR